MAPEDINTSWHV